MALPIFFIKDYNPFAGLTELDEDTSRHVVQVLRMKEGESISLADGKGNLVTAAIATPHKKHCTVSITSRQYIEPQQRRTAIAISLLKNTNRFEWFLEKAAELGIQEIIPLLCERTAKEHFRRDRMQGILVSAMLQSQQAWLPVLQEPVPFNDWTASQLAYQQKFIAHCEEADNKKVLREQLDFSLSCVIAIGPEGDFSPAEIKQALEKNFVPVSLGATRLRTETAGVAAAVWMSNQ